VAHQPLQHLLPPGVPGAMPLADARPAGISTPLRV